VSARRVSPKLGPCVRCGKHRARNLPIPTNQSTLMDAQGPWGHARGKSQRKKGLVSWRAFDVSIPAQVGIKKNTVHAFQLRTPFILQPSPVLIFLSLFISPPDANGRSHAQKSFLNRELRTKNVIITIYNISRLEKRSVLQSNLQLPYNQFYFSLLALKCAKARQLSH